jgi:putative flavoprotein involved in K+ transport
MIWWFEQLGIFDRTPEQRGPLRVYPAISGAYGGYTIDYRRFAASGMTLLGRVAAARGGDATEQRDARRGEAAVVDGVAAIGA